jgi:DNA-binding transcriptional ArsR family regulator
METASGNMTDFCLVVLANDEAVSHASETVRSRFAFLAEETRMRLISAVAERVEKLAEHGDGGPIAVSISLEADVIQGAVSTEDDTGEGTASRFEIFLSEQD